MLKNPGVPFKSTHPLLSNLSFMPEKGAYTPPAEPEAEETDDAAAAKSKAAAARLSVDTGVKTGGASTASVASPGSLVPIKVNKPLLDPEVFK